MGKRVFTDQMNREVALKGYPRRIISLVPSQTELLFDLGLDEEIVGITKFCVRPPDKSREKPKIGGTKKINFEKIAALQPDLIIGNKEENEKEQIEQLKQHYPVWMSDVKTLEDALSMIRQTGALTGKERQASQLAEEIQSAFSALQPVKEIQAAYMIWKEPFMAAGEDTFVNEMLNLCGLKNAFGKRFFSGKQPSNGSLRYPEVTSNDLREAAPAVILLSSEPYPFREKHLAEFREICPHARIRIVDGEMFSWYGSRLKHAPEYFVKLLAILS